MTLGLLSGSGVPLWVCCPAGVCHSIDCRGEGRDPFLMAQAPGERSTPFTLYNAEVLENSCPITGLNWPRGWVEV
jgi:hypothetical protein